MCGVFGYVSRNNQPIDPGVLCRIASVTEKRGHHAWGLAWIDAKGRLKCFKQTGRITCSLGLLRMAADARLLIGHCRYATQGDPRDNITNHPHPCDGGWFVHNGMIRDYDSLVRRFGLNPVSECDSEVLGLLIEQEEGKLLDRCIQAVLSVPKSPLVFLGLWKPGTVIAVRQGNPLHLGATRQGYYLASLAEGLPGKVTELPDNQAIELGKEKSNVSVG